MEEVTQVGRRLIEAYKCTQERAASAERSLSMAREDAANAERELATWLTPSDMKNGETIGVWMGDSIFAVTLEPSVRYSIGDEFNSAQEIVIYEPRVTVRTRGKRY